MSQCTSCELIFTNPRPADKELGAYYKSEEYISHTNNKKGWFNKLYQLARKINIKSKLNIIGNLKGELLEIGSGTGDLLKACKKVGWSVKGVEPNLTARNNAKQNFGLDLFETLEQAKIKDKSQDIIMMWHVLEHGGLVAYEEQLSSLESSASRMTSSTVSLEQSARGVHARLQAEASEAAER